MFCRNCGKGLIGNPEFCANCGARPMKGTSFCPGCGAPTTPLTEICPKCGARVAGKVKAGRKWPIIVGIVLLIVLIPLGILAAVVAYNVGGFLGAGTEESAKTEKASVQTALIAGMADNSVGSIIAGTITPSDTTRTVYYPETVYHSSGSFQLEDYMHLPTHGSWTWDSTGIVTHGTYSGGGETCVYDYDGTPQWRCTAS